MTGRLICRRTLPTSAAAATLNSRLRGRRTAQNKDQQIVIYTYAGIR